MPQRSKQQLAVLGGQPSVTVAQPHFVWPPQAGSSELKALAAQRQRDINIKGRTGPIAELEDAFLQFLDNKCQYSVSFNSGTSALLAAYFAVGIEAGDEVICPAITYHAAVSPLYFLRANPVLIDVDAETWCVDPSLIEAAITEKTRAITVVHQWGHPAEMDAIMDIAHRHNLAVIEDCSHAHGSRYKGQPVGTIGDIGVFSLQAAKMIFAGEGGMLVTNNAAYHDRATLLGHYRDRSRDQVLDPFYQQFWVTGYGLKLRMSPFNAVVAKYSLEAYSRRVTGRHRCLEYLSAGLADLPELQIPVIKPVVYMGAWYGYKPLYNSSKLGGLSREKYVAALKAEGVEVDIPGSPALSSLPLFRLKSDRMYREQTGKRVYAAGQFRVAESLASRALSMPTFTDWRKSKPVIDQYITAFHKVHDLAKELL